MNAIALVLTLVLGIAILAIIQPSKKPRNADGDGDKTEQTVEDDKVEESGKKRKKKSKKNTKSSSDSRPNDAGDDTRPVDTSRNAANPSSRQSDDPDRIDISNEDSLLKPQFLSAVSLSSQISSQSVEDEDGWIEVKKKKTSGSSINSTGGNTSTSSTNLNSSGLTKKQRENQKKAQKIKEIKDIQRLEQEEKLRQHRLNQMK